MTNRTTIPPPRLPRVAGAIQVEAGTREALDARYPLTVLRGARGFGKTSVLVHWLRAAGDDIPTIYVTLDHRAGTEDGFWTTLATALGAVGMDVDPRQEARAQVLEAIGQVSSPLRLVLDDFHFAAPRAAGAGIDDDLLDLVRNDDGFYLVVAGRVPRLLETAGAASVGTVLLGPQDLKLSAPMVLALAEALQVPLQESCARQIVADLGGWPGAIRAGLTNTDPENVVDERLVAGYLEAVLRDHGSEQLRTFVLSTAVPEDFDTDLAALLTDEPPAAALRVLQLAGFLRVLHGPDGVRYSYYPAIRRAFRQVLEESHPVLKQQVHERLMSTAAEAQNPATVLRHAARAELWDAVCAVVERNWMQLLTAAPAALLQVVDAAPATVVDADPRLRVVRKHGAVLTDPALSPRAPWPVDDDPALAADLGAWPAGGAARPDPQGLALALWGSASLRGGNPDAAIYASTRRGCTGTAPVTGPRWRSVVPAWRWRTP